MKILTVRITSNYGTRTVYPMCEQSKIFAAIAGTKTLTAQTIDKIKELGYTIEVQAQKL